MLKNLIYVAFFSLVAFKTLTGVFDLFIYSQDGDEISLSNYAGKKMLIVVLPVTKTAADSSLLRVLDTLHQNYKDSVTFIGIPSYEDGFQDDSVTYAMEWYRSMLDSSFIISGGMNTRKASAYQSPLFAYLTHAADNGYFDDDVHGAGEKFFINSIGELYGISIPEAEFNETIFRKMIQK